MAAKKTSNHLAISHQNNTVKAAISGCHGGQHVQPVLRLARAGRGHCRATLYWLDLSDREYSEPVTYVGPVADVETALEAEGLKFDTQGIYG